MTGLAHGTVLASIDGPVARITLNLPSMLNAQNVELMEDLEAAVDLVAGDPAVRVLVGSGAGRAFSAGLDLDMREQGVALEFFERQERTRVRLEMLDAITIAAVRGDCLGGGLQLAIACDLRVCSTDARLGLPATLEGLIPGLATVRLPRLIGLGPARRLILSGETMGADEALRLGLADHVVPAERFDEGLAEIVARYRAVPPTAAAASKRLMRLAFDAPLSAAVAEMPAFMARCLASPDAQAAADAWRQRRAARRGGKDNTSDA